MDHRGRASWLGVIGLCATAGMAAAQCPRELVRATGLHSLDEFGRSVAWIGDINHDGHADLAVGSPRETGQRISTGVVRVYSGADGAELLRVSGSITGELF